MRLQELFETTEEDRALISLSSAIYGKLQSYISHHTDEKIVNIGKIGDMFNTPIETLDNVSIEIQGGESFLERAEDKPIKDIVKDSKAKVFAFWEAETDTIVLNVEYLSEPRMRTTITHELRHALDEYKSGSFPASPRNPDPANINKYFTPKKKEHKKNTLASPAEINARFVEILDVLSTSIIPRSLKLPTNEIRPKVMNDLKHLFVKYDIAKFFPEETKSNDYKRLIKRAVDFIDKELSHNGVFYPKSTPNLG